MLGRAGVRAYLQNREDWNKTDEDTPEYERCHEESDEIERRISATPAEGIHGLAVKLRLAADDLYDHKNVADQEALEGKHPFTPSRRLYPCVA